MSGFQNNNEQSLLPRFLYKRHNNNRGFDSLKIVFFQFSDFENKQIITSYYAFLYSSTQNNPKSVMLQLVQNPLESKHARMVHNILLNLYLSQVTSLAYFFALACFCYRSTLCSYVELFVHEDI